MTYFNDARGAIRQASHDRERCAVAYRQSKGWHTYDPLQGCPEGSRPEFLCGPGRLPLPLNDVAFEVLSSAIVATAQGL